ncbi:FxSxx-COOH system tetratricopeptide repeat protein [Streptomyces sp. SLBN-31]|uniref:FxSxx-COOH system tetratricopeptide repeat protein n=1 Tax=Streptomyces sp. SLBN-31 TaxID=2768444 RepID=UPI00116FE64C|nr:FxSxx-COOH system tetratricopeptide repeat protein [Streptomyces sp. SLBN-31]TQJ88322.1 tetratricopeptide repeat protein [Streptomyces sp. SLBN-31]
MSTTGSAGTEGSTGAAGPGGSAIAAGPAKIISFYSFKGGAGRTMALANAAWIMASQGKSVLVIDWDLEAPDLHVYYGTFLPIQDLTSADGVLDMFSAFAKAAAAMDEAEDPSALHPDHTDVERYQIRLEHDFPNGGRLHYMGPGRMGGDYADRLARIDWNGFRTSDDGSEFLEALRARLLDSDYDYVLIDSRTGFSGGAEICTLALPDTVVIALTMSRQAIQGARKIAERICRSLRPIGLHVVPTRVDRGEQDRMHRRRDEARRSLDPYLGITDADALATYWGQVKVPYVPYYTYGEELAVMRDDPRDTDSLLAAYVSLVDRVTDGAVREFQPVPSAKSRAYRQQLAHRERLEAEQEAEPCTVTILHAPNDRLWADWIGELLAPTRIQIVQPGDKPADSLPDSTYVLALLSPHLAGTPAGETVARLTTGAPVGAGPGDQQVIGVRVSTARLAPHFEFDWHDTITLDGQNEEVARQELLGHFGLSAGAGEPAAAWAGPRFPGRQPEVWDLPMRNAEFIGRVEQLNALREGFDSFGGNSSPPQVLCGLDGVGKQQIALEYAHRFASQYDMVWWVPAAENVQDSLTRLARAVGASGGGPHTGEDRQALLERLRQERRRWLLVFDGVKDQEAVKDLIPTGGSGHVLITSGSMEWAPEFTRHPVDPFTPEESVALLSRRLPGASDEELLRLAERLGHLPIWEKAAANVLRACPQDIDLFIEELDSRGTASQEEVSTEYRDFTEVCKLAYEDLRSQSPAAARLLDLCAFLSPDGVGMNVVKSDRMLELLKQSDPELNDADFIMHRHLKLLGDQALAVQDPRLRTLKVPRVVQDLVRGWMTEEERDGTRAEVLGVLAAMVPNDLERHEPEHARTFVELDRHVMVSGAVDSTKLAVHRWLVSQVYHRWMSGDWKRARELGELVLERWRQALGPEHLMVLRMESQLGAACRLLGDYRTALELTTHAAGTLRANRSNEADILLARRGYAADLRAVGRFREARDEDQGTFLGLKRAIGEDANGTLAASHNLALSKFYVESVPAAIRQEQQAHEWREQIATKKDPKPWVSYAHLGTYHREAGDLATSERYLDEARTRLNSLLGTGSHQTLGAVASLGMTMVRRGEVEHGLTLVKDAYVAYRDTWGEQHPRTMSCGLSLAIGLHAQGRTPDAVAYTRDMLGHYVEVFGDDHPFTGICRSNLALYLLDFGQAEEAKEHAGAALVQLRDAFDRRHRYTLVARINHNNCMAALDELSTGELALEDQDIYDGCKEQSAWGESHPVTLTAMANLLASRPPADGELAASLERKVAEYFPKDHRLATALLAEPYLRIGADLEVQGV